MARYTIEQVNQMLKRAGYSHQATAQDLAAANKFGEKVFAKTRDKIFNAPPVDNAGTGPQGDIDSLLNAVHIKTPEELTTAGQNLYDPYFNQLGTDLQNDFNLTDTRNTQDFNSQQQFDAYGNQIAANQATGNYNDRFGETFGSPLQQNLERQRMAQQNLQQEVQQRSFQRRQYDIGEILRKGQQQNTQNRQEAIGGYVATNQFLGL